MIKTAFLVAVVCVKRGDQSLRVHGRHGQGRAVCGGLHYSAGKTQHQAGHGCWAEALFQATEPTVHVEHFESDPSLASIQILAQNSYLVLFTTLFYRIGN